ncbi:MAG: hypothetical protein WCO56_25595 [Verrucomicrobiota bacterium]
MKTKAIRFGSPAAQTLRLVVWSWLLMASLGHAQTSWKGTSSTAWATAANWTAGVPTASLDAIIGDANFTGPNQPNISATSVCRSLTLGTGTIASTLTISRGLTVSGNITIGANGRISHTSTSTTRVISLTGNWSNSGIYVGSSSSSTVTFSGTSQTLAGSVPTGFRRLVINASSTTTLAGNISVTNTLSLSGTLDPGAGAGWGVSGAGTLSVANGGKLLVRASAFTGNYSLSGTKTLSAGSTVDYAASGNQTVTNLTYSTLRISGSGVKTLIANLPALVSSSATAGNLDIAAGTLDLATFTASRGTTVAGGTVSVAAGAALKIGGTGTFPANYATHALASTSTVEYNGTNQTVTAETYGHLILSSSGAATKTMPGVAFTIAGNWLSVTNVPGASVAFTAGAALTVNGNVSLGGGTTFNGGAFSHSIGGNWTNNGTFTGASSTITMNGVNGSLSGGGVNNFTDLVMARSGITADASTSLSVAGNFSTTGAGTFTHTPGGVGVVTMSGASKSISGTGIAFNKLTISGTISSAASFTVAENLTVNGSLTASGGTITFSGTGKTISGSGTMAFSGLNVPGSVTTASSFSLSGNLSVAGSLSATAGLITFTGTTVLNGTANLFDTRLNGTLLQMGANAVLRLAGNTTLSAGAFDVTNQRPNTIVYNSANSQTVLPITYDSLEIAAGGTKTAGGNLTVWSDFTIDSGAVFSGGAGAYTNYVRHHWLNYGTFNAGNSTVELVGPADSTIVGATAFNQLRVNKEASSLLVNLSNTVSVATLDMASGTLNTGPNTLTLTTTRTGSGHVLGTITRQHAFTAGVPYAFEGPFTTITFASLTSVSSVTIVTALGTIGDFPAGAAINRQYTVSLAASGAYSATFRAYYQNSELNGNDATTMQLWNHGGSTWALSGKTGNSTTDQWVEKAALTDLAGHWTMATDNGIVRWNGAVSTAWETAGNWTIVSGSPSRPPTTNNIVELGTTNVTYQPTITSAAEVKGISFGSAQAITLTLGTGGSLATVGNVAGSWTNNVTHTIQVGTQTLSVNGDLALSDGTSGHAINLNLSSGTVNVTNDLVQSGGANLTFTGAGTLNLAGSFLQTSGTFTAGTGTVNYLGSGAQTVAGVAYHQLAVNKSAGIATLASAATVYGNLAVATGGRLRLNAALPVAGTVTIGAGAILDLGGMSLSVGGDWICSGTLDISSGGEVVFNGAGAQTINAGAFHDFDINKPSGTATLAGNLSVAADADVFAGTLDLSSYAIDSASSGVALSVAAGARLRTAGSFPTNFATLTLDRASTVEYYGAGSQTIAAATYGQLIVTNGSSTPKTLAGPITVAGDLLITNATLAASSHSLTLLGNWNNLGAFTAGIGTVILNGTNQTVTGATTFKNLTVPGSYTVANCDITIQGNATITGSYAAGTGTHTIDGDLFNSGSMSSAGTTTFTGTRLQTIQLLTPINSVSSGIVNFNGTVPPVLNSSASPLFANVNIHNTGGVTASVGWTVYYGFTVGSGASFNGGGFTHLFYGTVTNLGTLTSSGTLNFSPTSDTTLTLGSGFASSGTVVFSGAKHITLSSGALALGSVHIANTHAAGLTPVSNWTLAGDLQVDGGSAFHAGSGFTHSLAGSLGNNGIFDGGASQVVFNGTSEISGVGSTVFNNLQVSGSLTNLVDITVTGNFANNGAFDAPGVNLNFTGSSPSALTGTTTPTPIDSLVIAKSSATVTLGVSVNSVSTLTIASGTLDTGAYTVSEDAVNFGGLTVGANATLMLGGGNAFPTFTSGVNLNAGSTIHYSGAAQTVAALTYANLKLSGSGNKTLATPATINGNVDIAGSAKFNLTYASGSYSAVGSLTLGGALQLAGTWGSTSSAADNKSNTYFQGTGKLNVGNRSLDHFAVSTPGPQTAGTPFTITTITAQDVNNNTVPTFTGTVDLTETGDGAGGTVTPAQSGAFTAGVLSGQSVTLTKAGAGVTITVADHAGTLKSGVSDPFAVNPGVLHHYAVTFSAPPFSAGVPFTTYATAQDANNNTVTNTSGNLVTFTSSSTNMTWDGCAQGTFEPTEPDEIIATNINGVASIPTKDKTVETGVTITVTDTNNSKTGTSAAIDIVLTTGAYRTLGSGSWSDASTWQTNNGASWDNALNAPDYTMGVVTVQSNHTVTVTADVAVDQVYVERGGQLTVNPGVTLTVRSDSVPGLELYGSLVNNGVVVINSGSQLVVFNAGALVNSDTITATGLLRFFSGATYRHLFTTTPGTIPTAEWRAGSICEIAGYTSNTTLPGGRAQSFYHFTWNCPGQTGNIVLGGYPAAVGGNFTVTSTGSGALTLGGNLVVPGTASVGSEGRLNCGTYTITGAAFTLGSGGTLGIGSADGITSSGASGNIQTTTRGFPTDANYTYNGAAAQVPGNGLPAAVNHLTINNSAGLTLGGSLTVNGTLTLTAGKLATGASKLILGPDGSVSGGGSGVYVVGTVQKDFNLGSGQSFTFPVGDAANYTPVALANLTVTTPGDITANTTPGAYPGFTAKGSKLASQSVKRYWTLSAGGGLAVSTYDATFNFVAGDVVGGADTTKFLAKRYSAGWTGAVPGTRTSTSTAATGITGFGDFIVGTPNTTRVVLYDFQVGTSQGQVVVRWQTASEVDTLGFRLYRLDGTGALTPVGGFTPSKGQLLGGIGATYEVVDTGAQAGETYTYKLVEVETTGGSVEYGPFARTAQELRLTSPLTLENGSLALRWLSRTNEVYSILRSSNLTGPFLPVATQLPATLPQNSYTVPMDGCPAFYKIVAQ